MPYSFFAKTDKRPKQRFFNPSSMVSVDDTSSSAGRDSSSSGVFIPLNTTNPFAFRQLRLIPSNRSQDELLERLMRNAENSLGQTCNNFLEQLVIFLKRNPDMTNRVPKGFHSNPLELVIQLGDLKIAKELIALKATVRPENRHLLKRIEHLLQPHYVHKSRHSIEPLQKNM